MEQPPTSHRIAEAVRTRLSETGKTQLDIVAETGISRTTLNRRMTGNSAFTVTELELIAAFLDTTVTALLATSEQVA